MKTLLVFALSLCFLPALAQTDTLPQLPYQRFPSVPPFKLLLPDSSYFSKDDLPRKKAVLVMLFSPDCEHCQHLTEQIIAQAHDFRKVQIVMVTLLPFEKMRAFYEKYELKRFSNIIVGKDVNYLLPDFYKAHSLPFLAFYNKKQGLISVSEATMGIPGILAELAR